MKLLLCVIALLSFAALKAEISIQAKLDRNRIFIDEEVTCDFLLDFPAKAPPDLFPFLYAVNHAPPTSFRIVLSSVAPDHGQFSFTLAPTHTGTLIFAPGVISFANEPYLVPAVSVECLRTVQSVLPFAGMLPLYPERKIDLNVQNRQALFSDLVLRKIQSVNQVSYSNFRRSWNALAIILFTIPCGILLLWYLAYYELFQEAMRPQPVVETPLQILSHELQQKELPANERWQKLSLLLRYVLGTLESAPLENTNLVELRARVLASEKLAVSAKERLTGIIDELEKVNYTGAPASDTEWKEAFAFVTGLVK